MPGVTWITDVPWVVVSVRTLATFAVWDSRASSDLSAAVSAGELVCATSSSGPLNPGPKPSASRSYACQVVVEEGSLPWSEVPSRKLSTGMAKMTMTAAATVASTAGERSTVPDQRAHRPLGPGAVTWPASRRCCRRLSTRIPKTPSSAGSKVTAAATVNATVSAQATARPFRKVIPSTKMPSSAMHTVPPANSTARPEVSIAATAASSAVSPDCRPRRCRVTMNSA